MGLAVRVWWPSAGGDYFTAGQLWDKFDVAVALIDRDLWTEFDELRHTVASLGVDFLKIKLKKN